MPTLPAEHHSRARDDQRLAGAKQAVTGSDDTPTGPTLARLTGRSDWPRPVRVWYDAWRRSPQARLFVSRIEWEILGRGAHLVAQFHDPDIAPAVRVQTWNAIRRLESELGATHTDRVRTHMKIRPEPATPATPATPDYRALLVG